MPMTPAEKQLVLAIARIAYRRMRQKQLAAAQRATPGDGEKPRAKRARKPRART